MEFEKKILIEKLKNLKKQDVLDMDYFGYDSEVSFDKDGQESEIMRKKGNKLFAKKNHNKKVHERIWMLYTKSIALASIDSEELPAAYANRSALLLHLKKFDECLLDIERALKITKSSSLKVKLFCRQSECYTLLQEGRAKNSLSKAKYWLKKVESKFDIEKLNEIIGKADKVVEDNDFSDLKKKDRALQIPYQDDYVSIRYNKKYGKHLIATKDIRPGEFICAEKFYVTSVNISKNYAYCSHCLVISWSLIPCDHCSVYMFCNENCKSEAWEKYHDVECLLQFPNDPFNWIHYYIQLSTKSLIMGIKETGDMKKLKDVVLKIKQPTDKKRQTFSTNKSAYNSFEQLISLTPAKSERKLRCCVSEVIRVLIKLIENTDIFESNLGTSDDLKDLIQNQDVIFTGSLLLRLMSICFYNALSTLHFTEACQGKEKYDDCFEKFCCTRGLYISPFTRMIRHNCNSNVDKICNNDGRVIYYALQPISKNHKIQTSYCSNFTLCDKVDRQNELSREFGLNCDCIACQENWPTVQTMLRAPEKYAYNVFGLDASLFMDKYKKIIKTIQNPDYKPSKKTINSFVGDIGVLFEKTTQPNVVADCFTYILSILIENRYCIKLDVPEDCKSMLE